MCGICGYISVTGKVSTRAVKAFRQMLLAIDIRGGDATGMAYVGRDGRLVSHKAPVKAPAFVKSKPFRLFEEVAPPVVIGHTRWATTGAKEYNRNNHPILSLDRRMALVHNGVIGNHIELTKKVGLTRRAEVDTEVIMRMIEVSDGADLASKIKGATPHLAGCYAVALLNADEPNRLYLFKHNNPIHTLYWREEGLLLFASESTQVLSGLPWDRLQSNDPFDAFIDIDAMTLRDDVVYTLTAGKDRSVERQSFEAMKGYYYSYGSGWETDDDEDMDYRRWKQKTPTGGTCNTTGGGPTTYADWSRNVNEKYPVRNNSYTPATNKTTSSTTPIVTQWETRYVCDTCGAQQVSKTDRWKPEYSFRCVDSGCDGWMEAMEYTAVKG